MAFKTWSVGDVLTAADVNTYLGKQAVIVATSGDRPTSPVEGMTIYETDTDQTMQWSGSAWFEINYGSSAWTALTIATGFANYTGVTGPAPAYRMLGTRVYVSFWLQRTAGLFTFGTEFVPFAAAALPAAARPTNRNVLRWGTAQFSSTNAPLVRVEAKTDGSISVNAIGAIAGTDPTWVMADFNYEAGL